MTPTEFAAERQRAGLTCRALAAALGCSLSSVYRWEHDQRRIPSEVADRLRELARGRQGERKE